MDSELSALRDRLVALVLDILPDIVPSVRADQLPSIAARVADDSLREEDRAALIQAVESR